VAVLGVEDVLELGEPNNACLEHLFPLEFVEFFRQIGGVIVFLERNRFARWDLEELVIHKRK
jgi:hypothetical protein